MEYLKNKQYYIDLYDLHTIEECLDLCQIYKKGFSEKERLEKFKRYTKKSFNREMEKVFNLYLNVLKGERYENKEKTIQEWMERDRKVQEKYDDTPIPNNVKCQKCGGEMKMIMKDLLDSYGNNPYMQFMFECSKCNKRRSVLEDGSDWVYEKPKCPKCKSELKTEIKFNDKDDATIFTETCPSCGYKNVDISDHKKFKSECEARAKKEKELLEKYRDEFCLSDEKGQEFIELREASEVAHEVYVEERQKYNSPVYEIANQIKKTNIVELEKILTEALEKEKFIKLSFEKPEIGPQIIVPFTVQDSDSTRQENISTSDLKKLLNNTLKETNWRLMSDGVNYRLGFVFGRLKGYEGEDAMIELAGKIEIKKPLKKIDSAKREKYANHTYVQLARLNAEVEGKDNLRKKRLEKEPKGFAIPVGESYSCHICFTHIDSTNGWYDKYGFKCLDCQRAVDNGVLPPEVFEEENSWYTNWHVESEFHIPAPTIKKIVKQGILKPRIVTDDRGKDHAYVFMALENNDLLENYKKKHQIVLLCGIPSSGKTEFGKYLKDKHSYTYISIDSGIWPDNNLRGLWSKVFDEKRQYDKVEKFVCYLYENYENVVLEWNFPMDKIETVALFERQWCVALWFLCNTFVAKEKYIKKNRSDSVHLFDKRIKEIEDSITTLNKRLKPTIINVLKEDKSFKTMEEIYSDFSLILEDF